MCSKNSMVKYREIDANLSVAFNLTKLMQSHHCEHLQENNDLKIYQLSLYSLLYLLHNSSCFVASI